ncbi:MAG: hypothetical protein IKA99_00665 [Clostridia bacterium]|nr:hypothetical protein [Clostridia bacterium]
MKNKNKGRKARKNIYNNVDFLTNTTYCELQLLYAKKEINKKTFAKKILIFWKKAKKNFEHLCLDYGSFRYCFDLCMDEIMQRVRCKNRYRDFFEYYQIIKATKS